MKNSLLVVSVFAALLIAFNQPAQAQSKAFSYLEKIDKEIGALNADTWDYVSAASHGKSARKINNRRKDLLKTNLQAKQRVSNMQPFDGDASFRDSVVAFLQLNYNILNHDYEKIMDMEDIAEQSYDMMEAYLLAQEKANEKLDAAGDRLQAQQQIFATNNKINLSENKDKISKKLESAGDVMKYYDQVYLIFFKSYKQEAYLVDAMKRNDINAMEQNKNALLTTATEGLEKIARIKAFKGDVSIKNSCKESLDFFKSEASEKIPGMIEFYMKKENMEKIKTAFDAKPEAQRTKEDADQYNKSAKDLNASADKFNATNNELNKNRSSLLDKWNNSVSAFMDKQVPKYK